MIVDVHWFEFVFEISRCADIQVEIVEIMRAYVFFV